MRKTRSGALALVAKGLVVASGCGARPAAQSLSSLTVRLLDAPQVASFRADDVVVFEVLLRNEGDSPVTVDAYGLEGAGATWAPPSDLCGGLRTFPPVDLDTLPNLQDALTERLRALGAATPRPCEILPGWSFFVPVWATRTEASSGPLAFALRAHDGHGRVLQHHVPIEVVAEPPLVLGPPLRGGPWFVDSGLAAEAPHRWQALQMHGRPFWAQRFAADLTRLDESGCVIPTDASFTENTRYFGYGEDVLAVADGRIARVLDGLPENVPGHDSRAVPITVDTVTGNAVWLDLGEDRYAFYAHLIPGSIRVRAGDRVRRGDVLGRLGNSGNSTNPHLHFHVARGLGGLDTNGLAYRFEAFAEADAELGPQYWEESAGAQGRCLARLGSFEPRAGVLPSFQQVVRFVP